jgi:hypothetical protein
LVEQGEAADEGEGDSPSSFILAVASGEKISPPYGEHLFLIVEWRCAGTARLRRFSLANAETAANGAKLPPSGASAQRPLAPRNSQVDTRAECPVVEDGASSCC